MAQLWLCLKEAALVTEQVMRALFREAINGNFERAGEIYSSLEDNVHTQAYYSTKLNIVRRTAKSHIGCGANVEKGCLIWWG